MKQYYLENFSNFERFLFTFCGTNFFFLITSFFLFLFFFLVLTENKQVLEKKQLFLDIGRNEMLRCCKIRPIMLDGSFMVNIKTRIPRLERGSGLLTMVSSSYTECRSLTEDLWMQKTGICSLLHNIRKRWAELLISLLTTCEPVRLVVDGDTC